MKSFASSRTSRHGERFCVGRFSNFKSFAPVARGPMAWTLAFAATPSGSSGLVSPDGELATGTQKKLQPHPPRADRWIRSRDQFQRKSWPNKPICFTIRIKRMGSCDTTLRLFQFTILSTDPGELDGVVSLPFRLSPRHWAQGHWGRRASNGPLLARPAGAQDLKLASSIPNTASPVGSSNRKESSC